MGHRNIQAHLWDLFWKIISSSLDAALMTPSMKALQILLAKGWTHVLTEHVSRNFSIEKQTNKPEDDWNFYVFQVLPCRDWSSFPLLDPQP